MHDEFIFDTSLTSEVGLVTKSTVVAGFDPCDDENRFWFLEILLSTLNNNFGSSTAFLCLSVRLIFLSCSAERTSGWL